MKNTPQMPSLPSADKPSAQAASAQKTGKIQDGKVAKKKAAAKKQAATAQRQPTKPASRLAALAGWGVLGLVLISLVVVFSAQRRAENITSALDESVLKGLVVDHTFNPNTGKRYVQVSEGAERNVTVQESGTILPVISRYNFKALTKENYKVIGAAPWALSINISSNKEDPELLRYLFDQDDMIKAFLARQEVNALLSDPKALAQALVDENKVKAFFAQEPVQEVLNSKELLEAFAGSRFMAYILISKAAKYYRDNPTQAAQFIKMSPTLQSLKKNPDVRKAVTENPYLKKIAPTLLK